MELKASDLRVGNYVQSKPLSIPRLNISSDGVTEVSGYGISVMESDVENKLGFKPIPLTEEWLLKFGFSNGNKELSNCDLWDKHWIGEFEIQKTGTGWSFDPYRFDKVVWFQYVHQLQNLYFALTGEELKIK